MTVQKTFPWMYLSFCDPDKPKGQQYIGCAMVPGEDMLQAVDNAWALGCNPGGEVMGLGPVDVAGIPEHALCRLMSEDGMRAVGEEMGYEGEDLELVSYDEFMDEIREGE